MTINMIWGTSKRDVLTGTEMNDHFYVTRGKDKIKNFDLENDVLFLSSQVDYDLKVRGKNVIIFGDEFKTILKGVDSTDSLRIETFLGQIIDPIEINHFYDF